MNRKHSDGASTSTTDSYLNQPHSNPPISQSASSVADPQGCNYEVFLSFCGLDTRTGFSDHLYTNLKAAGIRVFRDNEELPDGEEIRLALPEAITQSKISIPIFSTNYAFSKWCLNEAAGMVECMKTRNQLVLPIFYDVAPNQVRHQTGAYEEAFKKHSESERYDEETVQIWKNALSEIGALKGWEVQNDANRFQGKLVKEVVSKVWRELKKAHLTVEDTIIGVEDKVQDVMKMLDVGGSDVRIVGIYGIGGIGKTTLAKIIYNILLEQFEYSSFLKDVREMSLQLRGLEKLQTQLVNDILKNKDLQCEFPHVDEGRKVLGERFCDKKVLILLDDVDKKDQINALVANLNSFARGSIILITTRYKDVLDVSQVKETYEIKPMHFNEALLLFYMHAFRRNSPDLEYANLSKKIVETTGGLPLALRVIGSFLSRNRKRKLWEDTLAKLKKEPFDDVKEKLRISYDALSATQKQIFLDIACFFVGANKRIAMYMWDDCGYYPQEGVEILHALCLIKIGDDNKLWMHDQLRDLGRVIVQEENYDDPSERSRLWSSEDAWSVLENQEGTKRIQAMQLDYGIEAEDYCFSKEQFMNLSNLRFLRLSKVNVDQDIWGPLRKLSWLQWHHCRCPIDLMGTSVKLVILDLSKSNITDEWSGWSSRQLAIKLKVLILESCQKLSRMPNMSEFQSLEILSFKDCEQLCYIDSSIWKLQNLIFLSLKNCYLLGQLPPCLSGLQALVELHIDGTSVKKLPSLEGLKKLELLSANCLNLMELPQRLSYLQALVKLHIDGSYVKDLPSLEGLKKLELLSAKGCKRLSKVPLSIGHLTSLLELSLDQCGVLCTLPNSIGNLVKLKCLSLRDCKSLEELPDSIGQLTSLERLYLSRTKVRILPNSIGNLCNLQVLIINRSEIVNLPSTLEMLGKLEVLNVIGCTSLKGEISIDFARLCSLKTLKLAETNITMLSVHINRLSCLQTLNLAQCNALQTLPQLPSSLRNLSVTCRPIETFPDLSICANLLELRLVDCFKLKKIYLGSLKVLQFLMVYGCQELTELDDLKKLECLRELSISFCESLLKLLDLPKLSKLTTLKVESCKSLKSLPDISALELLTTLKVESCKSLESIPNISALKLLRHLSFRECEELHVVEGIRELDSLEHLDMTKCKSLESLDLSALKLLRHLSFRDCEKLHIVVGIRELDSLEHLDMTNCKSLESLDLSASKLLRHLSLRECEKLHIVEGIRELDSLEHFDMTNCKSIENLLNLSKLGKLKELRLIGCKKLRELQGLEELKSLRIIDIRYLPFLYQYVEKWPHIPWVELPGSSSKIDLSEYKVFLNFRGQDIINYVDASRGLSAFRDDGELGGDLVEAINQSKIFIPIFSEGYASSIRCLNELAHIVDCKKNGIELILPIFYDVTPDQVREQSGSYEEAFKQHIRRYGANIVENWRAALKMVGALKGWELQHVIKEDKEELVMGVLPKVLAKQESYASKRIVGLKYHVKEVMKLLEIDASDVRMVVIYGTAGVGKTILAKVLYNLLKECFIYHSFITDIRETSLQNMGLVESQDPPTTPKVLVVVDDVDHRDQFNALVPYIHNGRFSPGSRIIITSKNKEALDMYYVSRTYELNGLQFSDALDLFHKHAMRRPPPDFITLSRKIVFSCGRFPLTVEIIGSLLRGRDKIKWECVLKKLGEVLPHNNVKSELGIIYEELDDEVQEAFLEIACFFTGMDWRVARYTWNDRVACIGKLQSLSLVKSVDNRIWMHDQLRDFGREIVRQENHMAPGKRTRLWHPKEAIEALNNKQGADRIEAICLGNETGSQGCCFRRELFKWLPNLRFLQLNGSTITGDFNSLLSNLKYLRWHHCPNELFATNLCLKKLVILELIESDITDEWQGWSFIQMSINLKVLILKSCQRLTDTPDFSTFPELERLILDDCTNLNNVGPSIGSLKSLSCLSVKGCSRLEVLPPQLSSLEKLRELCIDGTSVKEIPTSENLVWLSARKCESSLEVPNSTKVTDLSFSSCVLPGFFGSYSYLMTDLDLSHTRIRLLPDSIEHLTCLKKLNLSHTGIRLLPDSIEHLWRLEKLNLSHTGIRLLPDSIKHLTWLEKLNLSHTVIRLLPDSIKHLTRLKKLNLSHTGICYLPDSIGHMTHLEVLNMCASPIKYLPKSLGNLENLQVINVSDCGNLNGEIVVDPMRLYSLRAFILDGTDITLPPSISGILLLQSLYGPPLAPQELDENFRLVDQEEIWKRALFNEDIPSSVIRQNFRAMSRSPETHVMLQVRLPDLIYSGYQLPAYSWDDYPLLKKILDAGALNRYRGGHDYVGWHSDDEKLYGSTPEIASVSFGCVCKFILKKKPIEASQDSKQHHVLFCSLVVHRCLEMLAWSIAGLSS